MSEISKFFNFWAISTCNTSKESIFHIEFNFKQKNYDLFEEKVKKSNFFNIFFKIDADHLSSNVIFSNLGQKILKLSLPVVWKRFEIKSHQRWACYLKPRRNGGPIPTGGGLEEPPHTLTRVKIFLNIRSNPYIGYLLFFLWRVSTWTSKQIRMTSKCGLIS